ncbi:NAD(P)-binding protein [Dendrothele bispora CBS 962.96]|uniref:NAD(P)-binding protein n=1 Tax=Dendrothele bispora (strain CBS 962.96) TaxID=1314807 RepID=A0A4S8MYF2_DENBC|nr:NAD(P)-binding protein [Dendrothele bispora CBS 962.96]
MRSPVILITGASRGIGLSITSLLLSKFNAQVITLSRSISPELKALASDNLLALECDIADENKVKASIAEGIRRYQHLDALILNAGVIEPICRIADDTPLSDWRAHFEINFFSLVTTVKATMAELRKSEMGGRIIFVSSGAAVKGIAGWGPYNAGKAAMNSLCRTLGEEEPEVTSIAVRPGIVDTTMQTSIREKGAPHMGSEGHGGFIRLHQDGKLLKPELPSHVIASLALKGPKTLSGQFISWDDDVCKEFMAP